MLKMDHIRTAFSFTRFPASQLLAADGNASTDPARQGGKIYREILTVRQKVGGGVWEGNYRGNGEKRRGKRVGRG
jgi:hypothetical protein